MLDQNFKPFLIEANSNPCIESKGKILSKIIYELIENVFMTAVDPVFPPPTYVWPNYRGIRKKNCEFISKDYFEANKFELIFAGR